MEQTRYIMDNLILKKGMAVPPAPLRRWLRDGYVKLLSARHKTKLKKRWMILFSDVLLLTEKEERKGGDEKKKVRRRVVLCIVCVCMYVCVCVYVCVCCLCYLCCVSCVCGECVQRVVLTSSLQSKSSDGRDSPENANRSSQFRVRKIIPIDQILLRDGRLREIVIEEHRHVIEIIHVEHNRPVVLVRIHLCVYVCMRALGRA